MAIEGLSSTGDMNIAPLSSGGGLPGMQGGGMGSSTGPWGYNFLGNALWSAGPGLVGVSPPDNLQRWQAENPGSDFLSGLAGMAVPYLGWTKATTGAGALAKGVNRWMDKAAPLSQMGSAPVRTGAAREIVRFAPFEAGRVAAAPLVGPAIEENIGGEYQGAWSVAQSAGTDLVLGGALGGIFGGLSAYGRKKLAQRGVTPGADLNAPLQVQLRQLNDIVSEGKIDPERMSLVQGAENRLKRKIIEEGAPEGKYFESDELNKRLGDMFRPKNKTKYRVAKLNSDKIFQSRRVAEVLDDLPTNWQAYTKFPRIVQTRRTGDTAKNAKNKRAVDDMLRKLPNGGESARWDWLPEEKTFVVSKKLTGDEHLVFKTDRPDMFLPEEAAWKRIIEDTSAATFGRTLGELPTDTGSAVWDFTHRMQQELPFVDWRGLKSKKGAVNQTTRELLSKSGFKPHEGTGEAFRQAGLFVRRYLAPAQLQTTDNPVANRIRILAKEALDKGEQLAQRSILGAPTREGGSQMKSAFFGPKWGDNGSIAARARKLADDPEEWQAVIKTIQDGDGWRVGIRKYGLSEQGVALLKAIDAEDSLLSRSIIAAQRAARLPEEKIFQPRQGHFMLSRSWQGNHRVPVYNDKGSLVYIAGGNTRSQALSIADEVVTSKEGWRRGESITTSEMQDIDLLRQLNDQDVDFRTAMARQQAMYRGKQKNASTPGTFKARQDVGGYQVEYDSDDFIRSMISHSRRYRKYESETTIKAMFKKDLNQLQWDDREAYVTLMDRLDKMYGKEGDITKAVNRAFDTVLSGVLGNNSASKITGTANKLLYRYALGFANIGYAVATMGTFIQTAFPMMHMINHLALQAPERLAKYTTYQPVFSERGARMLGSIDTMKIASGAFRELGNPDDTLWKNLQRAAEEGKTDPRFIDEWVGQTAVNKQRFKGVLDGPEGFSKFLTAVADTLPAVTERGARGHSFAMGHIFYRDVMGVTDPEHLYRLASDFTEKTQYMYSAGDRAQIFNGPLGGMFGLFKNWMSHYIGWMLAYAGEGVKYGNWKPLLWQMAGTTSIGGIGALPFIGTADDVSKAFNNEGMLLTLYEMQGGADPDGINMADSIYYGLPSLLGFSIQGTVSAPLAEPGADIVRMFSFAHLQQAQKIGNAYGATVDAMEDRGRYFVEDKEARRALLNAVAPKTLIRMSQAMAGPDLRSMNTGNTMVKDLSPIQRLMWGLSANPKEVEAHFEISRELFRDQKKMRERVGYYGQQLANMYESRDLGEVKRLMLRATAEGVPLDSIQRSAQTRMSRGDKGLIDAQFDEAVQARMQQLGLL